MAQTRSRFLRSVVAGALLCAAPLAFAQGTYPDHPLKLVVPFPPGGATDILGRALAAAMGQSMGQPIVVENRPGAGTILGAGLVAKSPADGYTLLLTSNTTFTLNPSLRETLPYDPLRSYALLGSVADMGLVLVVNPRLVSARTLKDFVAEMKAAPGKYSYGSFGVGSTVHFGAEMLKSSAGIQMLHVPYSGSSFSMTALMGGQVPVAVDTVVATAPFIKAGKIQPIAALGAKRLALLPQVPTVAESGYPGFEMGSWFALAAPAGLPAPVQAKLEKTLAEVMADPKVRQQLVDVGLSPNWSDGKALRERIETELPQMRATVRRADIHAE
ncbi:MAG: tripartite tricarboxylate transporter substrate binding protein [Proteobacteria bacterium]|nr:tripartite tricarboxylate transporter substrate binding protein [Pseudomonadota bacterium]